MNKIKTETTIEFYPFKNSDVSIVILTDGKTPRINWDDAPCYNATPAEAIKFGHALIKAGLKAMKL